jgi:hypothetical protein
MKDSSVSVWSELSVAGIVQGEMPSTHEIESPWYVKVLLAFSGWLAALFVLGFIWAGYVFIVKSNTASLVTGGLMIAAAYAILRMPKNEFFEHVALAVSLAGQALMIFAIVKIFQNTAEGVWWWRCWKPSWLF